VVDCDCAQFQEPSPERLPSDCCAYCGHTRNEHYLIAIPVHGMYTDGGCSRNDCACGTFQEPSPEDEPSCDRWPPARR
jgi:hypothetical protein